MSSPVVAIDGPAGTGKSTTAREVARRLRWRHVDSGAYYRVAALLALRHDLDLDHHRDRARLRDALDEADVEQRAVGGRIRVRVDDEDVTDAIRSRAVTGIVSRVAGDPDLRALVNDAVRRRVSDEAAIVDGRDIGSVVFPEAFLKVYLDASLVVRARRRARESEPLERSGDPAVIASYEASLAERDRSDRARATAPLVAAPDAIRIDTSDLDIETQVARVIGLVEERLAARRDGAGEGSTPRRGGGPDATS